MNENNKEQWKVRCELKIDMGSEENAQIFLNSFNPELDHMPMKRSTMDLQKSGNDVVFSLKTADITAFRATINSILQFGTVVDNIITYIEDNNE